MIADRACPFVALAVLAAGAACGDELTADVRYQVVGLVPVADGRCPTAAPTAPPDLPTATKVRFTFRDHGDRSLRCDAVLPAGPDRGAAPLVAVPGRAAPVDVYVEYFDDAGTLLARGQRTDVTIEGGGAVSILVTRTDAWSCPLGAASIARAFHSVTPLPTGEVLLLGGLVAAPTGGDAPFAPSAGAYVTGTAELYDPIAHRFTPVTIAGLQPRAFHEVLTLGSDGDRIRLLVVGGVGVAGDAAALGNVAVAPAAGGAPWAAVAPDVDLGRAGSLALPAELLVYDPSTRTFTRSDVTGGPTPRQFGAATGAGARPGEALAVVGGLDMAGAAVATAESVRVADGTAGGSVAGHPRLGATVTAIGAAEALVWGGDLTATATAVRVGDRLTMLDQAPILATGPADTQALNRGFHAAATVADRVAVIGGYTVGGGAVGATPFTPLVHLVDPAMLTATALDVPGAVAAGYPAATSLPLGDLLFSGGAEGDCAEPLACPSAQSFRIPHDLAAAPVATGAPGLARYGHRLTRLPDGTVLVTGGFGAAADPAQIRPLLDAELYDPSTAADDPLADLAYPRAAGDVARVDGAPVAACVLVGGDPR